MNSTVKDTLAARDVTLTPWTGFYFLQSLLINFALGYPFSLLYAVAFGCVLMLLWRLSPRLQKSVIGLFSLIAAMYFPFAQAYGSPNFNTLLALHSTSVEESSEILTIFPWYSYLVSLFILALGIIALRRKPTPKGAWNTLNSLCLTISVVCFLSHQYRIWRTVACLN